jgi:protein TonB
MLLHLAAGWLLLSIVRLPATPAASNAQTVALIFAPAPAPHAVPPPVPTVAAVTPMQPPEPPAPAEAPVPAAILPTPLEAPSPSEAPPLPEAPSPTEASPLPAIPLPPPAINALTPRIPLPPPAPRQPAPKPRPATPPRTAIATSAHPPAPAREAPPPAVVPAAAPEAVATTAPPAAPPAPIATDWQRELSGWLAAHKTYPDAARQRGEQGHVVLRFTVERSGKVLEVTLVSGSGSPRLDEAAQAMLRNASLPPFPAQMPQERVTATVQIRYRLTD